MNNSTASFSDNLKMTGHFDLYVFKGDEPIISGSHIYFDKKNTQLVETYSDHNLIVNTGRAATASSMTPLTAGGGFTIDGVRLQSNPITYLACGDGAYGMEAGKPVIDNYNDPMPPSSADSTLTHPVFMTPFSSIDFISPLSVKFTGRIPKQYTDESAALAGYFGNPEMTNPDGSPKNIEAWINEYALVLADGVTLFAKVNKKSTPKDGDLILVVQWIINF